jgi:conjugative transposon TraN protein
MKRLVKFFLDGLTLLYMGSSIHAQTPIDPGLVPLRSIAVPVTFNKMTSLIFPSAIRSGIRVSRDILVQRVKGVDNALELKALKRHFPQTNLAVYALDGHLYSFDLQYADDPPQLSFLVANSSAFRQAAPPANLQLSGLPANMEKLAADARFLEQHQPFLKHSARDQGISLNMQGIYLTDGLLWMTFAIRNTSLIPFPIDHIRIYTEDRKPLKRHASQELPLKPLFQDIPTFAPPGPPQATAMALPLFTMGRGRRLTVEMQESNGARLVRLRLRGSILLEAKQITH